jgi:hypothetical protein
MIVPVTVADQGTFISPEDADELVDLLTDAATVIGHLAGHPAAEDALAAGRSGLQQDCTELTLDLRLAAARLDEDTTARRITGHIKKHDSKGDDGATKTLRHAGENQHSAGGR